MIEIFRSANARGLVRCQVARRLVLFCSILIIVTFASCKSDYPAAAKQRPPGSEQPAKSVQMIAAANVPVERAITVTGTLAASDQATISVKVPGRVRTINVDLGSVVGQGQKIAEIDPADYKLRLQQAEAALAQARARLSLPLDGSNDNVNPEKVAIVRQADAVVGEAKLKLDRSELLLKQGVLSQAEYDAAVTAQQLAVSRYQDAIEEVRNRQALLAQRRSELALAQQQVSDTAIYAPFDGIVQEKRASLGEFLAAGAPIATVVKMNPLRLRAQVPEKDSRSMKVGQQMRVTLEGDSTAYSGAIRRISPTITEENRMLTLEAEVSNNGSLKPGSFVRGEIVTDVKNMVVTVPASAIVTFAGIDKVVMVKDGKAIERPITTGRRIGEDIEVLTGLQAGEEVINNPGNLQSGQPVTVAR